MVDVRTISGSDAADVIATLPPLFDTASVSQLITHFDLQFQSCTHKQVVDSERKYNEMKALLTALEHVLRGSEMHVNERIFNLYIHRVKESLGRQERQLQKLHSIQDSLLSSFGVGFRTGSFHDEVLHVHEICNGMKRFLEEALSKHQQDSHKATHRSRDATDARGNNDQVPFRKRPASRISGSEASKLVSALLPLVEPADLQLLICFHHVRAGDTMKETLSDCLKVCTTLRENLLAVCELLQTSNLAIDRRTFEAEMLTLEQKLRNQFEVVENMQETPFALIVSIKTSMRVDKLSTRLGESNDFAKEIKAYVEYLVGEERKDELSNSPGYVVDRDAQHNALVASASAAAMAVTALFPLLQILRSTNLVHEHADVRDAQKNVKEALNNSLHLLDNMKADLSGILFDIRASTNLRINWDLVHVSAESLKHKFTAQIEALRELKARCDSFWDDGPATSDRVFSLQKKLSCIRDMVMRMKTRLEEEIDIELGHMSPLSISPSIATARPGYGEYKVFISHAGEDKLNIAIPLWEALQRIRVRTFVDKKELQEGDEAPPAMVTAMETAVVGVFVLSAEFAARKWPMKELSCFQERQASAADGCGPLLIPLFYRLDVAGCSDQKLFERTGEHGRNVFAKLGFFDRVEREEASMKETRKRLEVLAKQTGIENDERVSNEGSLAMQDGRERLVRRTVDAVVKALTRLEGVAPTYALY